MSQTAERGEGKIVSTRLHDEENDWAEEMMRRMKERPTYRGVRINKSIFFRACFEFVRQNEAQFLGIDE